MHSAPTPTPTAVPAGPPAAAHEFEMRFTSSPGGARLARRLVSHRLDAWGHLYDSAVNETVTLITAELCANAVTHGRVPGRDFHLRLSLAPEVIRVEVSDARTERQPLLTRDDSPADAESGRGLLLVEALASRWDVGTRHPAPGKTVWAEVDCPPGVV
ncbi:ATP-binding protein [Streptomyces sp. NPDC047000]|uniref:ATP-binding protein n=1 Tax=Streptomyces sp. NPDC047000 TaxID=3155474 RepID=UPI0033F758E6